MFHILKLENNALIFVPFYTFGHLKRRLVGKLSVTKATLHWTF